MIGRLAQIRLLVWKNFKLQSRRPIGTIVEIIVPVLFMSIMVGLKQIVPFESGGPVFNAADQAINEMPYPNVTQYLYYPASGQSAIITEYIAQQQGGGIITTGTDNETELAELGRGKPDVVGIIYNNTVNGNLPEDDVQITLRFPYAPSCTQYNKGCNDNSKDWDTTVRYTTQGFFDKGPKLKDNAVTDSQYWYSGFGRLEWELGQAVASLRNTGALGADVQQNIDYRVQTFPFAEYILNQFATFGIKFTMPLILVLAYTYPVLTTTREVVLEKELRLKEAMKMMGLSATTNWTAWFLKSFILLAISTIISLCILSFGDIVLYSDMSVITFFYFSFVVEVIAISFMMSTFFQSAKIAAPGSAIIFMLTFLPFQLVTISSGGQPSAVQVAWSSLFVNSAQAWGWTVIGQFEELASPLTWSKLFSGASYDSEMSLGLVITMMWLGTFLFLFVTFYVERVFPGEFGVAQPWYFLFTKKYWQSPAKRRSDLGDDVTVANMSTTIINDDDAVIEAEEEGRTSGVVVNNLVKQYSNGKLAVNGVSLKMYENDVTCLLGHNGAGKTSTMSMLTGIYEPTSGSAFINGYNIRTDIDECRRVLGLCPQVNTLFSGLTVAEQLDFFGTLKGIPKSDITREIDVMLEDLAMDEKRDYFPSGLSGGMKRKLCVGIAFMGGSKVVFLDEPTSGMDPQARRSTWDLITKFKKSRTILLTTHFLDEADILGDRVAIMSEGKVKACGTPLFLKAQYGIGYQMVLAKGPNCQEKAITEVLEKHVNVVLLNNIGAELSYQLPQTEMDKFVPMFQELEQRLQELDIQSYGVSCTTLEEVFLKVGEMEHDDEGEADDKDSDSNDLYNKDGASSTLMSEVGVDVSSVDGGDDFENRYLMSPGYALAWQRIKALLVKRYINASRDWKVGLAQLMVPVAFCLLALCLGKFAPNPSDRDWTPMRVLTSDMYFDPAVPQYVDQSVPDVGTVESWKTVIPLVEFGLDINPSTDMLNYLLNMQRTVGQEFLETNLGAFSMVNETVSDVLNANVSTWISGESTHSLGVYVGQLVESLVRSGLPDPTQEFNMQFAIDPLPRDAQKEAYDSVAIDNSAFNIAFFTLFGIVCSTCCIMIFVVNERVSNSKNIQFISGVTPLQYWSTAFAWDFTLTLIPNLLILALFAAFQIEAYTTGYNLLAIFLLIQLYAWGFIPLMYMVSMAFDSAATAVSCGIILNYITGLATMIACDVLRNLGLTASSTDDTDYFFIGTMIYYVSLIFPNFCLGIGLMDLYKNWQLMDVCVTLLSAAPTTLPGLEGVSPEEVCTSQQFVDLLGSYGVYYPDVRYHSEPNYFAMSPPGIGLPLTALVLSGFVYFGLLLAIEYRFWLPQREPKVKQSHRDAQAQLTGNYEDDEDVMAEQKRVEGSAIDDDVVVLQSSYTY
ncbi:hypothetical protein, variant [Sphaeroforma arctica JP610]|uniref:ABC transporter domain-containing protein n=1 Tax=Sphaeroforma arctica JP610 TaxID=667725 RepID=A0A0L0G9K4_9EUKA|nr:hypothetical protein, variant [Sphaeroforma arctica JP610]KNC85707.1 hypothetical protein, variant [Sphaeroforma arctica JP610]|eukprot:XP_014159609.1 hypothetical protein, variant [Sphaeroforma arctica JP610]